MSQRAPAGDSFVPFDPLPNAGAGTSRTLVPLKVVPKSEAGAAFAPLASPAVHAHAASAGSGQPVVTLHRDGERVTGIRIECACGQVIELACSY